MTDEPKQPGSPGKSIALGIAFSAVAVIALLAGWFFREILTSNDIPEGVIPITLAPDSVEMVKGQTKTIEVTVDGVGNETSGVLDIASTNASIATAPSTLDASVGSSSFFDIKAGSTTGTARVVVVGVGGASKLCTVTVK